MVYLELYSYRQIFPEVGPTHAQCTFPVATAQQWVVATRTNVENRAGHVAERLREGAATPDCLMSLASAGQSQVPLRLSRFSAPSFLCVSKRKANGLTTKLLSRKPTSALNCGLKHFVFQTLYASQILILKSGVPLPVPLKYQKACGSQTLHITYTLNDVGRC